MIIINKYGAMEMSATRGPDSDPATRPKPRDTFLLDPPTSINGGNAIMAFPPIHRIGDTAHADL